MQLIHLKYLLLNHIIQMIGWVLQSEKSQVERIKKVDNKSKP